MAVSVRDVAIGVVLAAILFQCWHTYHEMTRQAMVSRVTRRDDPKKDQLKEMTKELKIKRIVQVTPRIHVAMGYALGNSIMIEGKDGVIIVDVTESMDAARQIAADFRKITTKPVKAIVYTHNHFDHINGAKAFTENLDQLPEVWAHHDILRQLQKQYSTGAVFWARASRQFGILIPEHINSGAGLTKSMEMGVIYPTKLMTGVEKDITAAGITIKLVHIPGETDDHIGVWVPEDRAFLSADDIYKAFPNLYAIRGTPSRDVLQWAGSIDRILSFKPQHLVPSHTKPVSGEADVRELLTGYRDAIQYVHDQTIRYMNKGYLPDEIVPLIQLPDNLASHPYLQELYGTVKWSVKGVFNSYMGWFNGDPVDLSPLTPNEMAQRFVELGGGVDDVTKRAGEALSTEDWQWGLVLSSNVLRVDPDNARAREVKAKCLFALGDLETSGNGRNYYYSSAMEALGEVNIKAPKASQDYVIQNLPLLNMFKLFQVRWNVEECGIVNSTIEFIFTDTKQVITMTTRNAVVIVSDRPAPPESPATVKVTVTSKVWRDALTSSFSGLTALASGQMKVEGGVGALKNVLGCFDRS